MSTWETPSTEELFAALLLPKNEDELKRFLRDLLTENEILEFANRWKAARLLDQRVPYTQIEAETGLSSATIARISKWLVQGEGGYSLLIERLKNEPRP
jgi:TrpR-related protein YerC/YecD